MGEQLKTAVLGLKDRGENLVRAVSEVEHFQIQAVADKDVKLAERVAAEHKCAAYDDYRQLIMQNQLDCLMVSAGIHSCDEHIRAAIKRRFNILKLSPLGRDFEESAEFVRLSESEGIKLSVFNPRRFAGSFSAFHEFICSGKVERVFMISGFCAVSEREYPSWQSDRQLSGGGVLLYNCYELIDQIVWNFGVPEQVYSLSTNTVGDKQQRLYLTEDTAIVAMKFNEGLICNVAASKSFGPGQEFLKVYGKERILTVSNSSFEVKDMAGATIEKSDYSDDERCIKEFLNNFALSILRPEENKLICGGRESLKTMAVIESAYLSGRTGMAEEPGRILQLSRGEAAEGKLL